MDVISINILKGKCVVQKMGLWLNKLLYKTCQTFKKHEKSLYQNYQGWGGGRGWVKMETIVIEQQ